MPLRRMAPIDLGAIVEIEQESPSPWTPEQIADELAFAGSVTLVSTDQEENVLGWCCARIAGEEAELLKIAVHPEKRRVGSGDALLVYLENTLKKKGVGMLFLEVRSKNLPALHFYRKHGFAQVGQRSGYYSDPVDDALILRKEICDFG